MRRLAGTPTGQAYIFVSAAGENMIVVVGGANQRVGPADVDALDVAARCVFLAQLETTVEAIEALFTSAAAGNGMRILNAAPALAEGAKLFPLADILVVNETELARYAGAGDVGLAARRLISRVGQTVIVTLGAEGAMAVDAASVPTAAGRPARVVDTTTGAGDCFCGVLAACLSEGAAMADALALANAAASISTERAGAAVAATLRAEVEAL